MILKLYFNKKIKNFFFERKKMKIKIFRNGCGGVVYSLGVGVGVGTS